MDAIVIGGGIMGVNIALHLARGAVGKVTLLEQRTLAAGSSGKSGAILRQHYSHASTIRLAGVGLAAYASHEARTGRDIGFRRPGMLFIARPQERAVLEANVALQQSLGVDTRLLEAQELRRLQPESRFEDDAVAAWEPGAGYVDPVKAVRSIAQEAAASGAEIRCGVRVTNLRRGGDRIHGVETADGQRIDADVVVNAGGPWARRLLTDLGLSLPLSVIRPEQAFFEPPESSEPRLIVGDMVTGAYWKPEPIGWTRVGDLDYGQDEPVPDPDHYDEGVSGAFVARMRHKVAERVPPFRDAVSWGGSGALYTVTPDANAFIGPVPGTEGLYLAAGFSGHGFKMGPAVGQGMAELITTGTSSLLDPTLFALDRLEKGAGSQGAWSYQILG